MIRADPVIRRAPLPDQQLQLGPGIHPVLQRVYAIRGISGAAQLNYSLDTLIPPSRLGNTDRAARLIADVLRRNGHILILADFDADGATSCALATRALREMGAQNVSFMVPNRFVDGYGLTVQIAQKALSRNPDLVVTVDNGISSLEGVSLLRKQGVEVLITDHHLAGPRLPEASVIVNPNSPGEEFPSKHLAGVGVVFYVMVALRAFLREEGWFDQGSIREPNLAELLDLVALGTVADVVRLDRNNRILVQQGLQRIRAGQCCPLIRAILTGANRHPDEVVAADLGFVVGPRLNAAGRIDDMSVGIVGLLSDSMVEASRTAQLLDELNRERRSIEQGMKQQATRLLDTLELEGELPGGICVYDPGWHQGVIGILASRIKERYHRPVIAFAEDDETSLKGSARSVASVHIRDALDAIATANPGLLEKFGGHAMAAGLSLAKKDLAHFRRCFDEEILRRLEGEVHAGEYLSDGPLLREDMTLPLAEQISRGGPWGQGFPEPLFDGHFRVLSQRRVGGEHARLVLQDCPGTEYNAIAFNQAEGLPDRPGADIHAVYRLTVNRYRGERQMQLQIVHFKVTSDE
ncbi:MAG: single-stranded-DNA-specific exonuclease RecJ [Sedimenticola sp.]|nr:single-stranded-DNA-specific exonuclease RecJ [Sedimenticola sp.]